MISLPHALRSASTTNVIRDSIQSMYVTGLSENKSSAAFCSAALIAPMWLLTLAECVNASKWAAIASNSSLGDDGTERIEVDRWVLQPHYTNSSGYQQLALLELKTASQYAPANISWNDNLPDNSTLWVRGFDTSTSDKSLVETTAKLWRYDECDKFYYDHQEYGRTLNESMLCLRDSQCQQERGSAVMVNVNGTSRLIGLTYWQSGNTTIAPAVFLPITSAKEFIQSTLQATTSANSSTAWIDRPKPTNTNRLNTSTCWPNPNWSLSYKAYTHWFRHESIG
ncbi:hypothetical protein H257_18727 [Aphanomyces astaci]|uniref:Peptidase S1 domain-containing protein n=1 Tax=Aphanomyces astaci TaxID=112090 RepID=W4FCA3_APHAT|nr:hypothetical protein H257_18727 [Aphanomyces astaci]ETV64358.1 hypothetical protein H257_18727 [Aphanomyces astaci]|eukprot:XP_009846155.1 hypothetical protein H257_18727 [Aphanomyces astaci]